MKHNRIIKKKLFFISLFVILLIGGGTLYFCLNSRSSSLSASILLLVDEAPLIKKKADLKISNISMSEGNCLPNGERPVNLQETIQNIGTATSSRYLSALYNEGVHWAGSYGSTQIPIGGQSIEGNGANLLGGRKYDIKVVIMPIRYDTPNSVNWPEILNYVNRSLDSNQNNNSMTQTIFVTPCP